MTFAAATLFEAELEKLAAVVSKNGHSAYVFGRLPVSGELRWIHAEVSGNALNRLISKFKRPAKQVKHHDGPFGAGWVLKLRVTDSTDKAAFVLRMWNSTVSIEKRGSETSSFECLDITLPEELGSLMDDLAKKKLAGVKIKMAITQKELLEQLALGDPQIY